MYGIDSGFYFDFEQKKWIYGITEYPYKAYNALKLMNRFYNEKLILQDFMIISEGQLDTIIGSVDVFAVSPWSAAPVNTEEEYIAERKTRDPTYDLIYSESIRDSGIPYKPSPLQWAGQTSYYGLFVNSKTRDPEMVCSVIDYLFSDEIRLLNSYVINGVTYEMADGKPRFMSDIRTNANPDGTVDAYDRKAVILKAQLPPDVATYSQYVPIRYGDMELFVSIINGAEDPVVTINGVRADINVVKTRSVILEYTYLKQMRKKHIEIIIDLSGQTGKLDVNAAVYKSDDAPTRLLPENMKKIYHACVKKYESLGDCERVGEYGVFLADVIESFHAAAKRRALPPRL